MTRLIGDGGQGEVYEAVEVGPLKRVVAIKILRFGMDTRHFLSRFETERHALGIMDHPGIPRVFAAGATEGGLPYFVMEYVPGLEITTYCDEKQLGVEQRLRLLIEVCDAVQHAHQKGIIHQDLKASNVLVVEDDQGRPSPKVVDFGIARAVGERDVAAAATHTRLGVEGTLEYLSPEQVAPGEPDVDTRADVYALGVILYRLLSGALPFEPEELRSGGMQAARRRIMEEDPPLPSAAAEGRPGPGPHMVSRTLRGDLDAIVMKALSKDRSDRYASPSALALDIQRYLRSEPIVGRSHNRWYYVRKFVRRHRAGVAVAGLVLLSTAAGGIAATAGLLRARRAERAATEQAMASSTVSDFFVGLFEAAGQTAVDPNAVTAREILERGHDRITGDLEAQPEIQSQLMHSMGSVYAKLGLNQVGASALSEALAQRRNLLGERHPLTLQTAWELSQAEVLNGNYARADTLITEVLEARQSLYGDQSPEVAEALFGLSTLRSFQGRFSEGEATALESVRILRGHPEADQRALSLSLYRLASQLWGQARYEEAIALLREALEIQREFLPALDPDVGSTLLALSLNLTSAERWGEAIDVAEEAVSVLGRVYGDRHFMVGLAVNVKADAMNLSRRFEEAERLYLDALSIFTEQVGDEHYYIAQCLTGYSVLLYEVGRLAEAEAAARRAIDIFATTPDAWMIAILETTLGAIAGKSGRIAEGEEVLLRSHAALREKLGLTRWTQLSIRRLVEFYESVGRQEEANRYRELQRRP